MIGCIRQIFILQTLQLQLKINKGHWINKMVPFSSSVSDSLRPHGLKNPRPPCLSITNSQSLLKLMSIDLVMPSNQLVLCHPFLLLPSIFPSIRVFSSESVLYIRWPKYQSFNFSISPSNEYSGLISFRTEQFDLPAYRFLRRQVGWSGIPIC